MEEWGLSWKQGIAAPPWAKRGFPVMEGAAFPEISGEPMLPAARSVTVALPAQNLAVCAHEGLFSLTN